MKSPARAKSRGGSPEAKCVVAFRAKTSDGTAAPSGLKKGPTRVEKLLQIEARILPKLTSISDPPRADISPRNEAVFLGKNAHFLDWALGRYWAMPMTAAILRMASSISAMSVDGPRLNRRLDSTISRGRFMAKSVGDGSL